MRFADNLKKKINNYKLFSLFQIAEEYDEEVDIRPQVVHANLDAELLLLLKEINYLCGEPFNIHLPPAAKELLRNTDAHDLRTTATRLETIVSKYNNIMRSITEFERPLFERKLSKIDIVSVYVCIYKPLEKEPGVILVLILLQYLV